ncbi:MAG: lasso peptide biosynthesis B2 protein [Sphingomonadaceae bacterium]|nr:lasso peptide biosynthesis B2 protein [Sphingomonadaceae bacterium]
MLLAMARFLILVVPLKYWRGLLGPIGEHDAESARAPDAATTRTALNIGRLVRRVAARAPFSALCLPQAIAAKLMLRRRRIASQIHVGARSGTGSKAIDLHAWLMIGELCVTGDDERTQFKAFRRSGDPRTMEAG